MLKFGLHTNTRSPEGRGFERLYQEILEEAILAEKSGFSILAVDEHHMSADGYFPTPMLVLAGIATRTTNLLLLPSVTIVPLHNPVQIAEEGAMLDVISKGRFILGAGQGSVLPEYWGYGLDWKRRGQRLSEGIDIILKCWLESEPFNYEGKFIKLSRTVVMPKPLQKPRPPIWIAATNPKSAKRAATLGDAWLAPNPRALPELDGIYRSYESACKALGKEPRVVLMREGYLADDSDPGMEEWAKQVRHTYLYYYRKGILREPWIKSEDDLVMDRLAKERFVVGNVDDCIDRIEKFSKAIPSMSVLILRIRQPGMSHQKTLDAIRLFGERVIPYFTEKAG